MAALFKLRIWQCYVFLISLVLVGCGGSDSSSDAGQTLPPLSVNAGSDVQLDEKLTITLRATASPDGGTYTWRQNSGPLIEGFPLTGAEQQVLAPDVKQNEQIELVVDYVAPDNRTVSDSVIVKVNSVNLLPVVSIKQTAPSVLPSIYGDTITLSSNDSFDPDENGALVDYLWQQTAGKRIELTQNTSANLSFSHPLLAQNEDVRFSLTITDDEGGSQTNSLPLTLQKNNQLLIADAGVNQEAYEFTSVTLDASNSQSISEHFSCSWAQLSGASVAIDNLDLCITQFILPDVDTQEILIFEVTVIDDQMRSDSAQTQIIAKPKPLSLINDSGMALCYDNTSELNNCSSSNFPGQDAALGRDVHTGLLDKVGTGPLAFDFTKLDAFAGELPDNASNFSCVRDNISGLIWEVKQVSSGTLPNTQLREGQNSYSWYYSGDGNGDNEGLAAAANSSCPSNTNCGLEQFTIEVNSINYCGGNNWRVPTHAELMSLFHYGQQGSGSVMISDYFPNTATTPINNVIPYWTIQTSVEGGNNAFAWALDIVTGKDIGYPKANLGYIRLVRDTSNDGS